MEHDHEDDTATGTTVHEERRHIISVRQLLVDLFLVEYSGFPAEELRRLHNKLWWLANFNVPVEKSTEVSTLPYLYQHSHLQSTYNAD